MHTDRLLGHSLKMLGLVVALVGLLVVRCASSSPVYNLQPALITTNIGSSGRNIRHLPCVSRKNGMEGVCMFAIDCIKANGTHLGTCIDYFYFGSCCHVAPREDPSAENSVDFSIIPSRQPPQRLSTTEAPPLKTTTMQKISTSGLTTKIVPVTQKITTTSQVVVTKETSTTAVVLEDVAASTEPTKLTTFQSVQTVTSPRPTTRPKPPRPTAQIKPVTKPRPQPTKTTTPSTPTPRPPTKPLKVGTTTSFQATTATTSTTRKPSTARPPTTQQKPAPPPRPTASITKITTTPKPTTPQATTAVLTSFEAKKTTTTPKPTTEKATTTTTATTQKPFTASFVFTNELPIQTSFNTSSQTANEIEVETPTKTSTPAMSSAATTVTAKTTTSTTTEPTPPMLVTWAIVEDATTTLRPTNATLEDEWMPGTTPDNWVLLPSLSTLADNATLNATTAAASSAATTTTAPVTSPQNTSSVPESISSSSGPTVAATTATTPEPMTSNATAATNATSEAASSATTPPTLPTVAFPLPGEQQVNMSDFTDVCGRRMYPEARIVGGERSNFGRWPWQISLRQWRTSTYLHKCGAALLNENWAITAAHCVDNVPPSDLLLRLGEHDLSSESEPYLHQERRVQIVASHPQFDPRTFEYDLALLRFYEPVRFQPNIIPVCVPQDDENFVGRTAHVTGWGRLYEDGPLPSVLQEVAVPVINNTLCEAMYRSAGYIEHIPNIFICAGWKRGGFDSCEGDSGGPLVIQRPDKRFVLAGVISWGIGCAEPNQPGVYTRISEFRDWINQILQF